MWAVPTFVSTPIVGRAISARAAISWRWFMPISTTANRSSSDRRRSVSGTPKLLLRLPRVARSLRRSRMPAHSSLVVVLPLLPVMPMSRPSKRDRCRGRGPPAPARGVFDVDEEAVGSARLLDPVHLDQGPRRAPRQHVAEETMGIVIRPDDCDEEIARGDLAAVDLRAREDLIAPSANELAVRPGAEVVDGMRRLLMNVSSAARAQGIRASDDRRRGALASHDLVVLVSLAGEHDRVLRAGSPTARSIAAPVDEHAVVAGLGREEGVPRRVRGGARPASTSARMATGSSVRGCPGRDEVGVARAARP